MGFADELEAHKKPPRRISPEYQALLDQIAEKFGDVDGFEEAMANPEVRPAVIIRTLLSRDVSFVRNTLERWIRQRRGAE